MRQMRLFRVVNWVEERNPTKYSNTTPIVRKYVDKNPCFISILALLNSLVSRLALKIVFIVREQGTEKRFWATLLFVIYFGFFPSPT